MGRVAERELRTLVWRVTGLDLRALNARRRRDALHLGAARAAPKAGVRRRRREAMMLKFDLLVVLQ